MLFLKSNHELRFHQYDYSKPNNKEVGKSPVLPFKLSIAQTLPFRTQVTTVESAFEDCRLWLILTSVTQIKSFFLFGNIKGHLKK